MKRFWTFSLTLLTIILIIGCTNQQVTQDKNQDTNATANQGEDALLGKTLYFDVITVQGGRESVIGRAGSQ
jgi:hypothetical protein